MIRKKISQREAVRNRKELRELKQKVYNWGRGCVGYFEAIARLDLDDYSAGKIEVGAMFGRQLIASINGRKLTVYSVKSPER